MQAMNTTATINLIVFKNVELFYSKNAPAFTEAKPLPTSGHFINSLPYCRQNTRPTVQGK